VEGQKKRRSRFGINWFGIKEFGIKGFERAGGCGGRIRMLSLPVVAWSL
jgi:hypothetical protein